MQAVFTHTVQETEKGTGLGDQEKNKEGILKHCATVKKMAILTRCYLKNILRTGRNAHYVQLSVFREYGYEKSKSLSRGTNLK